MGIFRLLRFLKVVRISLEHLNPAKQVLL